MQGAALATHSRPWSFKGHPCTRVPRRTRLVPAEPPGLPGCLMSLDRRGCSLMIFDNSHMITPPTRLTLTTSGVVLQTDSPSYIQHNLPTTSSLRSTRALTTLYRIHHSSCTVPTVPFLPTYKASRL